MNNQSKVVAYNFEASEFDWELAPGKMVKAWGFNQQLPGPVLRASKGDTLVVRVTNNSPIVKFPAPVERAEQKSPMTMTVPRALWPLPIRNVVPVFRNRVFYLRSPAETR